MAEFIAISILDFVQNIWYRHGQFEVLSPTVERATRQYVVANTRPGLIILTLYVRKKKLKL